MDSVDRNHGLDRNSLFVRNYLQSVSYITLSPWFSYVNRLVLLLYYTQCVSWPGRVFSRPHDLRGGYQQQSRASSTVTLDNANTFRVLPVSTS